MMILVYSWSLTAVCLEHSEAAQLDNIRSWLCEQSIDNSWSTTKASKFSAKHWEHLKSPDVNQSHLNVSHFQECFSAASTNSDEETVWPWGCPQRMRPVFLFSHPRTQKCLQTVAAMWEACQTEPRRRRQMIKDWGGGARNKGRNEAKEMGEMRQWGRRRERLEEQNWSWKTFLKIL